MRTQSSGTGTRVRGSGPGRPGSGGVAVESRTPAEAGTRSEVVQLLLEDGPISATEIGARLGLSAAGARRHIEALVDQGEAMVARGAGARRRGPGRPAKMFQLTAAGRARLGHAYDDLAGAALRELREIGGEDAVAAFARRRVRSIVEDVGAAHGDHGRSGPDAVEGSAIDDDRLVQVAEEIARAMSRAGYVADSRRVGQGVQICQHHCPVAHVAAEFPEFCEAEQDAFRDLLGTHIQQLATIANGDAVCTTHVPLGMPQRPADGAGAQHGDGTAVRTAAAQPPSRPG